MHRPCQHFWHLLAVLGMPRQYNDGAVGARDEVNGAPKHNADHEAKKRLSMCRECFTALRDLRSIASKTFSHTRNCEG